MRFAFLIALVFAFPVAADDKADIAALKAELAAVKAELAQVKAHTINHGVRIKAAEDWGGAMGGYHSPIRPLPPLTASKPARVPVQVVSEEYPVMGGYGPPAVTVYKATPVRRTGLLSKMFGGCYRE